MTGLIGPGVVGGGHILHGYQHIAASIELLQDGCEFGDRQRISGVVVGVVISVKGPGRIGDQGLEGDQGDLSHIWPDGESRFGSGVVGDGLLHLGIWIGAGAQKREGPVIVVLRRQYGSLVQQCLIFSFGRQGLAL